MLVAPPSGHARRPRGGRPWLPFTLYRAAAFSWAVNRSISPSPRSRRLTRRRRRAKISLSGEGNRMASLRVVEGPQAGLEVTLLLEETIIGRGEDCDLVLPLTESRRACRVSRRGDRFVVDDLGSPSGTYLSGTGVIRGPHLLADG